MAARSTLKHGRVAVFYKEYATVAEREAAEGEAQLILLAAAEEPVTAANVAAGSFSFELEADSEGRRIVLRASGNERMLARVASLAAENGWERRRVRVPALRTEAHIVETEPGVFSVGDRANVAHPEGINRNGSPKYVGNLVLANIRPESTVAEKIAEAAASAENTAKMTRRARRSSIARGKIRTDVYAAAYGAASRALHANAAASAGGGGGGAGGRSSAAVSGFTMAAARAAAAAVFAEARPDMTAAQIRELVDQVISEILMIENPDTRFKTRGGARKTHKKLVRR